MDLLPIALVAVGLILLVGGARLLVGGAAGLAGSFGISPLVIGLRFGEAMAGIVIPLTVLTLVTVTLREVRARRAGPARGPAG